MIIAFGVLDNNNCLIDTSRTLLGAKQYATKNGYNRIGKRVEYNVTETYIKEGKKWQKEN
jgi:hypothetical protein